MFWYVFGWCLLAVVAFFLVVIVLGCAKMASKSDRLEEEYWEKLMSQQYEDNDK